MIDTDPQRLAALQDRLDLRGVPGNGVQPSVLSCAGSTGGGIKRVRMLWLLKQARHELVRIAHPRVVDPVTLGGQAVPQQVLTAVLACMRGCGMTLGGLTLVMSGAAPAGAPTGFFPGGGHFLRATLAR